MVVVALLVGAAIGFTALAFKPGRPNAEADPIDAPGSGITTGIEVTDIWLPAKLSELASRRPANANTISEAAWHQFLERKEADGLWYAVTLQLRHADGRTSEITNIVNPTGVGVRSSPPPPPRRGSFATRGKKRVNANRWCT